MLINTVIEHMIYPSSEGIGNFLAADGPEFSSAAVTYSLQRPMEGAIPLVCGVQHCPAGPQPQVRTQEPSKGANP